ncbi:MAG: SPASM domain-containing protein [Candidatus Wallbacteria bacterium]|nr:SPASM domain-containing protein [Candidatus Wallbacteria bacterium]
MNSDYFRLIRELYPYQKHTLQLELTDRCNLACPSCNQGMGSREVHGKESGFLHPGLFRKIMDDLKKSRMRFFEIQLFWFGEPLLHPDFDHIFSLLLLLMEQDSLFAQIDLHTNGMKLDGRIRDLLLFSDIKMPMLTISLDSIKKENYNRIRVGGELDKVLSNIRKFVETRETLGQLLPALRIQFLLQEANREELPAFIDYWKEYFRNCSRSNAVFQAAKAHFDKESYRAKYPKHDSGCSLWPAEIFTVNHPIYPHETWKLDLLKVSKIFKDTVWIKRPNFKPESRQLETDRLFDEVKASFGLKSHEEDGFRLVIERDNQFPPFSLEYFGTRPPCAAPFFKPVVRWDGTLNMCCNDPLGELALGNLHELSFDELWFSQQAKAVREAMLEGKFNDLKICRDCRNMDGITITREQGLEFMKKYQGSRA